MNTKYLALPLLFFSGIAYGADIIVTTDQKKIDANIEEVSSEYIKYKKTSNPNGPQFVIKTSEVVTVIYDNGEVQNFGGNISNRDNSKQAEIVANGQFIYDEKTYPQGTETRDWNDWLDYINIVSRINFDKVENLYIMKVDDSKITYPDKSDNQYEPLVEGVESFNSRIEKAIRKKFPNMNIFQVKNFDELSMKDNSVLFVPKFDHVDMGSRAARAWVGFGAGAQTMRISGYAIDNTGKFYFNFWHQRKTSSSKRYQSAVNDELDNLSRDIANVFEKIK